MLKILICSLFVVGQLLLNKSVAGRNVRALSSVCAEVIINVEAHPVSQDIGNPENNFNVNVGNNHAEHHHEDKRASEHLLAQARENPSAPQHTYLIVEEYPLRQNIGNPENNFNLDVVNTKAEHAKGHDEQGDEKTEQVFVAARSKQVNAGENDVVYIRDNDNNNSNENKNNNQIIIDKDSVEVKPTKKTKRRGKKKKAVKNEAVYISDNDNENVNENSNNNQIVYGQPSRDSDEYVDDKSDETKSNRTRRSSDGGNNNIGVNNNSSNNTIYKEEHYIEAENTKNGGKKEINISIPARVKQIHPHDEDIYVPNNSSDNNSNNNNYNPYHIDDRIEIISCYADNANPKTHYYS